MTNTVTITLANEQVTTLLKTVSYSDWKETGWKSFTRMKEGTMQTLDGDWTIQVLDNPSARSSQRTANIINKKGMLVQKIFSNISLLTHNCQRFTETGQHRVIDEDTQAVLDRS